MSRKLHYYPNLYGEGKGGTLDAKMTPNGGMLSSGHIRRPFGIICLVCGKLLDEWGTDRARVIEESALQGWRLTHRRNYLCPECSKKTNPVPANDGGVK